MRRVADPRPKLGSVPIESIRIDALSRDDIPAILKGLQLIWCDADKREEVFATGHAVAKKAWRTVGRAV